MQGADQRENERSDANNALEEYCFRVRHAMENESLVSESHSIQIRKLDVVGQGIRDSALNR
jgi:hypothetical protein